MKPLKLKMIRTYQSVQFNKKEHTIIRKIKAIVHKHKGEKNE